MLHQWTVDSIGCVFVAAKSSGQDLAREQSMVHGLKINEMPVIVMRNMLHVRWAQNVYGSEARGVKFSMLPVARKKARETDDARGAT